MNQALIALRELLNPSARELAGVVTAVQNGQYQVATKTGTRGYPAAPGVAPSVGQRVVIENGMVSRLVGAGRQVPTFFV